jgi:hypothetical protein
MAECKNVVGESGCIGVVLLNTQVGFMVKQTIQNVRLAFSYLFAKHQRILA